MACRKPEQTCYQNNLACSFPYSNKNDKVSRLYLGRFEIATQVR